MSSVDEQVTTRHMAAVQQSEFDVQRFPVCVSLLLLQVNIKMVSTNSKLIS